jgi:hypothetical protein
VVVELLLNRTVFDLGFVKNERTCALSTGQQGRA